MDLHEDLERNEYGSSDSRFETEQLEKNYLFELGLDYSNYCCTVTHDLERELG